MAILGTRMAKSSSCGCLNPPEWATGPQPPYPDWSLPQYLAKGATRSVQRFATWARFGPKTPKVSAPSFLPVKRGPQHLKSAKIALFVCPFLALQKIDRVCMWTPRHGCTRPTQAKNRQKWGQQRSCWALNYKMPVSPEAQAPPSGPLGAQ